LDGRADLEMPRVILRPGEAGNLPAASLGAKPCKPMFGKATVVAVAPSRMPQLVMKKPVPMDSDRD